MTSRANALSVYESDLMNAYITAIPFHLPNVRVFRRNIIAARLNGGHFVRAGIPGQADLYVYIRGWDAHAMGAEWTVASPAIPIEIECKGPTAKWTPKQKAWRAFCEEWRIPYLALESSADDTPGVTVLRWVEETRTMVGSLT